MSTKKRVVALALGLFMAGGWFAWGGAIGGAESQALVTQGAGIEPNGEGVPQDILAQGPMIEPNGEAASQWLLAAGPVIEPNGARFS